MLPPRSLTVVLTFHRLLVVQCVCLILVPAKSRKKYYPTGIPLAIIALKGAYQDLGLERGCDAGKAVFLTTVEINKKQPIACSNPLCSLHYDYRLTNKILQGGYGLSNLLRRFRELLEAGARNN